MTVLATEAARLSDLVKWEEGGQQYYSREIVTILSGETVNIGSVLGKVTASGKYVLSDADAVDGSQAAAAIALENLGTVAADTDCIVLIRDAIVGREALVWHANNDAAEKLVAEGELKALGILVRDQQPNNSF